MFRKISLLEDNDGNIHLKNLSVHPASNEEEGMSKCTVTVQM